MTLSTTTRSGRPAVRTALRTTTALAAAYAVVSLLDVLAVVLLRHDPGLVNATVWVRSLIVAGLSLLLVLFARRAAAGDPRALLRLRIIAPIVLVACLVFAVLPGLLPVWMRVEQGVCAVLLLGVVTQVNGSRLRAAFADA